jgi:hypothetical protein
VVAPYQGYQHQQEPQQLQHQAHLQQQLDIPAFQQHFWSSARKQKTWQVGASIIIIVLLLLFVYKDLCH